MKSLSESVISILQTVTVTDAKQPTQAPGSTLQAVVDTKMNTQTKTALIIPQAREFPLTVEDLRMTNSVIELMQQQGRLKISSVSKEGRTPKRDYNGEIYGWEFDLIPTGEFTAKALDPTQDERQALEIAITPGHYLGIQKAIEQLAQIKPIGSSAAKQTTVISYLTYDLHDECVSEFVVQELCKEYRKKPILSEKDRFFPDNGDFLSEANRRMKKYKAAYQAIKEPKSRDIDPYKKTINVEEA